MAPKTSSRNRLTDPPLACKPLAVTKQLAYKIIGSPKLVQRWLYWSRRAKADPWLIIAREGSRGTPTLIDYNSLKKSYLRYLSGDVPLPMPSEKGGGRE